MKKSAFVFDAPELTIDSKPLLIVTMSQEGAIEAFAQYLTGYFGEDVARVDIMAWMGKGTVSNIHGSGVEFFQPFDCLIQESLKRFEVLSSPVICSECGNCKN